MRGYGIPQVCFAIECFMDDIAKEIRMDPLEFRKKNLIKGYYEDAYLKPIAANTNGIFECLKKGAEYIHWMKNEKNMQIRQERSEEAWECLCFPTNRCMADLSGNRRRENDSESGRKCRPDVRSNRNRARCRHCIFSDDSGSFKYGYQ